MAIDKGATPFVMIGPKGWYYIGLHKNELECWEVGLGWPPAEEIVARKKDGWAVYPATLTVNKRTSAGGSK
jgi:hypothetical protein